MFVGIAVVGAMIAMLLQWYNSSEKNSDPFYVPDEFVFIQKLNGNEGVILVGEKANLELILNVNGTDQAVEKFGPGKFSMRILWGGLEKKFGFLANGNSHFIPFPSGVSNNSIGAKVKVDGTHKLAVASRDDCHAEIKLKVTRRKPPP